MCDEREQLIEYVYGETSVDDRKRIDAHLVECHVCRAEVSGLRAVRDDLLAWDVPKHEPVWRPFVPPAAATVRRAWSTWALAAAAGAVFSVGLAGGMAARGWVADPAPPSSASAASQSSPQPAPQVVSTVTTADLAQLEAAILARVRSEMAEQLKLSQPPAATPSLARVGTVSRADDLEARLAGIEAWMRNQEAWMDDQILFNNLVNGKVGSLSTRTSNLSEQIELSRMQRTSLNGGVQ